MEDYGDWNPMSDAYEDKRHEMRSGTLGEEVASSKRGDGFEVVVKGINPQCGELAVKNLFSKVGKVIKCSLLKKAANFDTLMGFVRYRTQVEAEKAIEEFDNFLFANYKLQVRVAMTQEEKNRRRSEQQGVLRPPPDRPVGMGRGRASVAVSLPTHSQPQGPSSRASGDEERSERRSLLQTPPRTRPQGPSSRASGDEERSERRALLQTPPGLRDSRNPARNGDRQPALSVGSVTEVFVIPELFEVPTLFACHLEDPKPMGIHERYSQRPPCPLRRFNPEDLVAAPFNGEYYRARVVSRGQSDADLLVTFIDYGNQARVSRSQLRPLDAADAARPPLLVHLAFDGADDAMTGEYSARLTALMTPENEIRARVRVLRHDAARDAFVVRLEDGARPEAAQESAPELPELQVEPGQHVRFFVDFSGADLKDLGADIACHALDPLPTLGEMALYYARMAADRALRPGALPGPGALVAAPYEGEYFRARVASVSGGLLKLLFVDYGNTETVDVARFNVFPLEERFVTALPALHVRARLAGFRPELEERFVERINGMVEGERVVLAGEVVTVDADTNRVVLDIGAVPLAKEAATQRRGLLPSPRQQQLQESPRGKQQQQQQQQQSPPERQQPAQLFDFAIFMQAEMSCIVVESPRADVCVVMSQARAAELDAFSVRVARDAAAAGPAERPRKGQLVYAPFQEAFYRGLVTEVGAGEARVFFLDYGNDEAVPVAALRRVGDETVARTPAFVVPCRLVGMRPLNGQGDFSEEAHMAVVHLLAEVTVIVQGRAVEEDERLGLPLLLATMSAPSAPSVVGHLIEQGFVDRAPLPESKSPFASPPRPRERVRAEAERRRGPLLADLPRNELLRAGSRWQDCVSLFNESPLDFTVIADANVAGLNDLTQRLNARYQGREGLAPVMRELVPGMLVVALSQKYEAFYRGCVQCSQRQGHFDIFFIDFGNVETLPAENLFEAEETFLSEPALSINCVLQDAPVQDYSTEVRDRMDSLIFCGDETSRIRVRVAAVREPDGPGTPARAVVAVQAPGGKSLLELLGLSESPVRASGPSPGPTAKSPSGLVNGVDAADAEESCKCPELKQRVKKLEGSVDDCQKKIQELEHIVYKLLAVKASN